MNILLVCQAFPPYPVVGALRAQKVAEMLRSRDHRVFVVTERLDGEGDELRVDELGFQVHTVPLKPPYRLRAARVARRLGLAGRRGRLDSDADRHAEGGNRLASPTGPGVDGLLRRAVLSLLWLPDDELRFVLPALRVARSIMREHRIDLVYTSSPPHSTHLVGLRLRRSSGVRWAAEFRDPWTDQLDRRRTEHSFRPTEAVHRWLERRCLGAADHVIAVTGSARAALAEKLPLDERGKVTLVLNGIAQLDPPREASPVGPFRIVHAGTFYHDRDPRPFLRALADLRTERSLGPSDLAVDFVGQCRMFGDVSVEHEVAALGLQDIVRFRDWLPQDQVQELLREADLLLLLATSQPLQVPNKLYEYLGSRVPVLGIVDADGESDRMLRELGGHHVASIAAGAKPDAGQVRDLVMKAMDCRCVRTHGTNEELLQEWSVQRQMAQLAEAVGV